MSKNKTLSDAKSAKNDEFYTQYADIQKEVNAYLDYDPDGNLTQDDRFNYTYDDENRLVSVLPRTPYPFNAVENAYDHHNRRIQKVVRGYHEGDWRYHETHTYVWDGWNIVLEQVANGDQIIHTIEYFWGNDLSGSEQGAGGVGGLLATRIDGVFYVPVYGANGNIMMYVGGNGWIAAQYDYDPYGNILQATGPLASQFAFGFSTKYHDREVGLVAYQLRTYNPVYGRWLNRDPIEEEGGENLYCFVENNSVERIDYMGEFEVKLMKDDKTPIYTVRQIPVDKTYIIKGSFGQASGGFFYGKFEIYSCEMRIYPRIEILSELQELSDFKRGTRVYIERRPEGFTYIGGPPPENNLSRPPRRAVLAHERGHARVFMNEILRAFRRSIAKYIVKPYVSEEEEREIVSLYWQANRDFELKSCQAATDDEVQWYLRHGFKRLIETQGNTREEYDVLIKK